jgi:hypothetical protein
MHVELKLGDSSMNVKALAVKSVGSIVAVSEAPL